MFAGTSGIVATKEFEKGAFLLAYKDSVTTTEEAKILGKEPMKEFLLLKCHSQWGELWLVFLITIQEIYLHEKEKSLRTLKSILRIRVVIFICITTL